MPQFKLNDTLGDIVAQCPGSADILKAHHIDYCCGGHHTLQSALDEKGIDHPVFLETLNEACQIVAKDVDWQDAPLEQLVNHILNRHHAYLYDTLPKLSGLLTTVLRAHGEHHPELRDIHRTFHALKAELEAHLIKEETIQYPAMKTYLAMGNTDDLQNAIDVIFELEDEHEHAGNLLKQLRMFTADYAIPSDVCATFALTYDTLEALESDMFTHIHLENNILFKRLRSQ